MDSSPSATGSPLSRRPPRSSPQSPVSLLTSESAEEPDGRFGRSPGRNARGGRKTWNRSSAKSSGGEEEEEDQERPNFFEDVEVAMGEEKWESPDVLMRNLRDRASRYQSHEAVPISEDTVETIGDVYAEERAANTLQKRQQPKLPQSPLLDETLDKVEQLERKIQMLQAERWKTPPIPGTINRILLGQSCCLEWYKSLQQKRELLDVAVATCDGNCIMAVLLFIRRTLEHGLLLGMLVKRDEAAHHYESFLKQQCAWKELASLYRMRQDTKALAYLKVRQCELIADSRARASELRQCSRMFEASPELKKNSVYVEEYAQLCEKQKLIQESEGRGAANIRRADDLLFQPLTTILLYCCRYHRGEPETNTGSPESLRKAFHVSERQYFQVFLTALCVCKDWPGVDNLLTTKGVFGLGKKKRSPIGFERVVKTLANKKHRAPDEILSKYLMEIEDLEQRFTLATKTELYDLGIDALRQLRDRDRLSKYINFIPPQKQKHYRGKIAALQANTQIKWKN